MARTGGNSGGGGKATVIAAFITAAATIIAAVIGFYAVKLQNANTELKEENNTLRAEASTDTAALERRISTLEAEIQSLRDENSTLQENYETVQGNYEAALREIEEKNDTIAQQKATIAERDATIAQQEATIADLQAQIDNPDNPVTPDETGNTTPVSAASNSDKPDVWLSDLDYFYQEIDGGWGIGETTQDNRGNEHNHSINPGGNSRNRGVGYRVYNLDGHYSRMAGIFFQEYWARDDTSGGTLCIYGDDDELLWQYSVARGIEPISFDVSLTGVMKLKIQFKDGAPKETAMGDVGLWLA